MRWLLETDEYALSDSVRFVFQTLDHVLVSTSENAETLAAAGYPVLRNLLIFTAHGLHHVEKSAGRLSLAGVPMQLAVAGMVTFIQANTASILGFAQSVPELRAYIEYHLTRLEIDYQRKKQGDGEDDQ
ncbi:hypothetical protein [Amorphus sp. MBR-141]